MVCFEGYYNNSVTTLCCQHCNILVILWLYWTCENNLETNLIMLSSSLQVVNSLFQRNRSEQCEPNLLAACKQSCKNLFILLNSIIRYIPVQFHIFYRSWRFTEFSFKFWLACHSCCFFGSQFSVSIERYKIFIHFLILIGAGCLHVQAWWTYQMKGMEDEHKPVTYLCKSLSIFLK